MVHFSGSMLDAAAQVWDILEHMKLRQLVPSAALGSAISWEKADGA